MGMEPIMRESCMQPILAGASSAGALPVKPCGNADAGRGRDAVSRRRWDDGEPAYLLAIVGSLLREPSPGTGAGSRGRAAAAKKERAVQTRTARAARDGKNHLGVLRAGSVRPRTQELYKKVYAQFQAAWWRRTSRCWSDEEKVDENLAAYLDHEYLKGEHLSRGNHVFASVLYFAPKLSKSGGGRMVKTRQALRGWKRLAPSGSRLAMPFEVMALIVVTLMEWELREEALLVLLTFEMYYWLGEPHTIRAADLIPPVRGSGLGAKWSLVLHPREVGAASKTNEYDQSGLLDLERHRGLGKALDAMVTARLGRGWRAREEVKRVALCKGCLEPLAPLFVVEQTRMSSVFKQVVNELGLENVGIEHMYQLRHGGASMDAASSARSLEEVRRRGRWQSWDSVRRYEKGARVNEELHRLPEATRDGALRCSASLGDVVARRCPPSIALCA